LRFFFLLAWLPFAALFGRATLKPATPNNTNPFSGRRACRQGTDAFLQRQGARILSQTDERYEMRLWGDCCASGWNRADEGEREAMFGATVREGEKKQS
jgi:hypothetical protein